MIAEELEYCTLTGYVTHEYTTEWQDAEGTRWRKHCTVINLGRADRAAADPDEAMQPEYLPYNHANRENAMRAVRQDTIERFIALREQIQASLAEHGPASAARLADRLGGGIQQRVLACLRRCPEFFVYHGGQYKIWALVGQEYTRPKVKKTTSCMIGLRDALAEYGPLTVYELMAHVKVHRSTIHNTLINNPKWFRVVDNRQAQGGLTRVWDLAKGEAT